MDTWTRFGGLAHLGATLALYALAAALLGLAIGTGQATFAAWSGWIGPGDGLRHALAIDLGFGLAFFAAGFTLLVAVMLSNAVLPTRVQPRHGGYYSLAALPWVLHNGLFYVARYTFLPFVTLTPFGPWFLRAMGMHVGRRAFINTELISDPRLIWIGDDAVIGGGVHLFAHYGGGGHLTIARVRIGDRATLGQGVTVMGDVEIGDDAVVLPHAVLLPGSRVPAGATWAGVPARPISARALERLRRRRAGDAEPGPQALAPVATPVPPCNASTPTGVRT